MEFLNFDFKKLDFKSPKMVGGLVVTLLVLMGIYNAAVINSLNKEEEHFQHVTVQHIQEDSGEAQSSSKMTAPVKKTYNLVPEDPAKYGIVSVPPDSLPKSQMHWDYYIEKIIKEAKLLESEKGKEVVAKMYMDKEDFEKTMDRVDEQIQRFEVKKREDPYDKKVNRRLQTLYKLKALSKVLKDKVTNPLLSKDVRK